MTVNDNAIQFSALSPSILVREQRLRVAHQILAVLNEHLKPSGLTGRRLLDVGCSSGIITSFLADYCSSAVGVDVDTAAIALARVDSSKPNLEFMVMNGATLAFPAESFDIVICNQMYYWLEQPDRLMSEIFRVLRPGGTCFFANVNKYILWENQYRLPLLPVLPKTLADALVRLSGRGERFACHYLSFWQLRGLCSRFVVHRYTARVLKEPDKYRFTNLTRAKFITSALPMRLFELLEPLSPNFIWLLDKP